MTRTNLTVSAVSNQRKRQLLNMMLATCQLSDYLSEPGDKMASETSKSVEQQEANRSGKKLGGQKKAV